MTTIDLKTTLNLKEDEYFRVEDHIFTTNEKALPMEGKIHFCGNCAMKIFKEFEGQLTMKIMQDWIKLSRALDQATSYEHQWDECKIVKELISGIEHPVSWYVKNCQIN